MVGFESGWLAILKSRTSTVALSGLALALAAPLPAQAQIWDGETNSNWSTNTNWDNDLVPGPSDTVTINNGALVNQPTIDSFQNVSVTNLSAGTLTVEALFNSDINVTGDGTLVVNSGGVIEGEITASGTVLVNGGNIKGNMLLEGGTLAATGTTTLSGIFISLGNGNGGTITAAAGTTLTLNLLNPVVIYQTIPTVTFGAAGETGTVVVQNTFYANSNAQFIVEAGTLRIGGATAGNKLLDTAGTSIASGATLDIGGFETHVNALSGAGTVTNSGGAATLVLTGTSTFSGVIKDGAGVTSLTKQGTGTLTLTGANTYTGQTTVSDGKLILSGGSAIADTGAIAVASGATLDVNDAETVGSVAGAGDINLAATLTTGGNDTSTTFSGNITGTGGLTKEGTGTFTVSGVVDGLMDVKVNGGVLALTGDNTFTGGITVGAGTLRLGSNNAAGAATNVITTTGSVIDYADGVVILNPINLDSDDTQLQVTAGVATQAGTIGETNGPRGFEKIGAGTLVLTGANTYTGQTIVSGGTLTLSGGSAIADTGAIVVASGTTLDVNDAETVGSVKGAGNINLDATLTAGGNGASTTLSGNITGAGGLIKQGSGTFTLTGANSFSGGISIDGGTLAVSSAGALGTGAVTINGAAQTLRFLGDMTVQNTINGVGTGYKIDTGASTVILDGSLSGGGASKIGSGTLVLNNAINAQPTAMTVDAGSLIVNGSLQGDVVVAVDSLLGGNGTITGLASVDGILSPGKAPGEAGTLTVGSLSLNSSSTSLFDLGTPGGTNDVVDVDGDLSIAGSTLLVNSQAGWNVGTGSYRLFNYGGTLTQSNGGLIMGGILLTPPTGVSYSMQFLTGSRQINLLVSYAGAFNWDGAGPAADGVVQGGSGTWDAASTNWANADGTFNLAYVDDAATEVNFAGAAGGTVTLDGARTAGSINFTTSGYTLTGGALNLASPTTISVAEYLTATIGSQMTGGSLIKTGAGTLTLTGNNDYTGATIVDGGTLKVNGSITSAVTVNNGSTLMGTGTVGSTMVNAGGTLAPGASIESLTIVGDLTLASGTFTDVEVDPTSNLSDLISVTGTATLGGTLRHIGLDGTYQAFSTYRILEAASVQGVFDAIQSNYLFLNPDVEYGETYVDVTLVRNNVALASEAHSDNQASVADAIDGSVADLSAADPAYRNLVNQLVAVTDAAAFRDHLDQLSGAEYAQHLQSVLWSTRGITRVITERMECAQAGSPSRQAGGAALDGPMVTPTADAPMEATGCFEEGRLALWSRGFASWNSLNGDVNAPGYDETQYGVLFGADYSFDAAWFLGVAGAYFDSTGDFDDWGARPGADIDYNGLQLAAYGGYDDGTAYLRGTLAYGTYEGDSERAIAGPGPIAGKLKGDPSSDVLSFYGEAGYRFVLGSASHLTPFAGISLASAELDGFTESDPNDTGAALEVRNSEADWAASVLGLRFNALLETSAGAFVPELSVAWSHNFDDTRQKVDMSFAEGPPGTDFTIESSEVARDALLLEASAKLLLTDSVDLGIAYNGWFSSDYTSNALAARLGVWF